MPATFAIECGQTVRCGKTEGVISAAPFQPAAWPAWVTIDVASPDRQTWSGERITVDAYSLTRVADAPRDRSFWMGATSPATEPVDPAARWVDPLGS